MTGLGEILINETLKVTEEKSNSLIKRLFNKTFEETGELIADQVRLRRYKNQITIFEKADKYLKNKNIKDIKINLKVLAPLLEYSSHEEDENLQELWAMLIKNTLSKPTSILMQQNSIEILKKISNEEVTILNYIYKNLLSDREKRSDYINSRPRLFKTDKISKPEDFRIELFSYSIDGIAKKLNLGNDDLEINLSNLVALGLLKYETEVAVKTAEKSNDDPNDMDLDIELDILDYNKIKITTLGFRFVELCTQ
ncbi:DUF4393 domain-containing protein [Myroides odoratimimus]|uniref:Abi-alpha family protein n=1 Tax=Myroides odoratimimus TaxID=76832 RepID=UPI002578364A|nr:Abi-alpha family protein [Myroides odoratimimus]MDM1679891.1 DUF4393 domain-containing protein [Myroides odoratimimus]